MTANSPGMRQGLLTGFRVLETGPRLASAVSGRLYAELGAEVIKIEPPAGDSSRIRGARISSEQDGAIFLSQNTGKRGRCLDLADAADRATFDSLARDADVIVSSWHPDDLDRLGLGPDRLALAHPAAVIVYITPFGLSGPRSRQKGPDLIVFHGSGLAKSLIGPVEDPDSTAPVRAIGEQSEFISGTAAACASMFGLYRAESTGGGTVIDVSMQEALAFMDVTSLAAPSFENARTRPRKRRQKPGPNLTILPASDGFVAISPREEHQWKQWLNVIGNPVWGDDPRFADRTLREKNSEPIHDLLSEWSSQHPKMEIFRLAQEARVPAFPLMSPAEHLESEQLKHRGFFRSLTTPGGALVLPGVPYSTSGGPPEIAASYERTTDEGDGAFNWQSEKTETPAGVGDPGNVNALPLTGARVADLSWVIAGPTCTRYLSAMGAEIVKIETSSRPDPGRAGQLHDVLGQGKRGITLNLKSPEGLQAIKELISKSDIVVENFAPGVMDRLGLGWDVLNELRPGLVMVSASGVGQTGPSRQVAAYGTLLQVFTGFAGLNGYPGQSPSIGMAWADPLCGLLLAFSATAALRRSRQTGNGQRVDFSMVEAMLSTMPGPLIQYQVTGKMPEPEGNEDELFFPHGVFHCDGTDEWVAVAATDDDEWRSLARLIGATPESEDWDLQQRRDHSSEINSWIEEWASGHAPLAAAAALQSAGVPAAASVTSAQLADDEHLNTRGFFGMLTDRNGVERKMPTLPWRWNGGETPRFGTPPSLGGDTASVLQDVLGYDPAKIASLEGAGALT